MKTQAIQNRLEAVETALIASAKENRVPVANLIGFEATGIGGGRAVVTREAGPQHANPMGKCAVKP